jgi:tRNA (guanine37-N1)-methyltransferase
MPLSFDILTIFPSMFAGVLQESILQRAVDSGRMDVTFTDIRDFTTDRHRSVDDRPYGGGPGMVFKPEPVLSAVESVLVHRKAEPEKSRKFVLSPQGRRLTQERLRELSGASWIVLLCGRYEGFDERIVEALSPEGFEEISIGDYVLTGGEIPAMVILEGVARLLPGVLGHPDSAVEESFEDGRLDHPHYTRPAEYRGMQVPEVLLSGDHRRIEAWRREQSIKKTRERRKDLMEREG